MDKKNYWEQRSEESRTSVREALSRRVKSAPALLALSSILLSNRLGDEAYVRKAIKQYRPKVLLDVACGGGKPVLPANCPTVYGVGGFPKDDALARGYQYVTTYSPPDYEFSVPTEVDVVTCINLNAHIPFDWYETIILRSLAHLKDGGHLILVNEHDNSGLSYARFKDPEKKSQLVNGMEHYAFGTKDEFLKRFLAAFPGLRMIDEHSLAAIVTLNQHYVYQNQKDPTPTASKLILVGDVLLGTFNWLYTRLLPKCESFLVGMVFEKRSSSND